MRHCFFFSNSARGFMRHCYFSYIIFTGSWINSFLASAWHFSYCLSYLGIGFKHLYPRFVCCSKFEWSTWHSCVWRKRVGAWAGATAQPQCSTGRCSLEWRPRGCVAVGRSQLVARGQRGNMLLIELKLKHIDVHRPAPSDMLMNLLPSSSFWSYMGDSYLFVVLSYCIYGSK